MRKTARVKAKILAINNFEKIVHFITKIKGRNLRFTNAHEQQLDLLKCVYPEIKEGDIIDLEIQYTTDKNGYPIGAFRTVILPPENFTAQDLVDNMQKFIK